MNYKFVCPECKKKSVEIEMRISEYIGKGHICECGVELKRDVKDIWCNFDVKSQDFAESVATNMKKRSKYNIDTTQKGIKKRTYNGEVYDSLTELQFLKEFIEPKIKTGEIVKWERQVPYVLQEAFINFEGKSILPIKYVADYVVWWKDDTSTVFDVKGNPDSASKIKRKIFWKVYPDVQYVWMCRSIKFGDETHWICYDELEKLRRLAKKNKTNN